MNGTSGRDDDGWSFRVRREREREIDANTNASIDAHSARTHAREPIEESESETANDNSRFNVAFGHFCCFVRFFDVSTSIAKHTVCSNKA